LDGEAQKPNGGTVSVEGEAVSIGGDVSRIRDGEWGGGDGVTCVD